MKVCDYCKEKMNQHLFLISWTTPNYPEVNNEFELCSIKCWVGFALRYNEISQELQTQIMNELDEKLTIKEDKTEVKEDIV